MTLLPIWLLSFATLVATHEKLSIEAVLQSLNSTHLKVSLQNRYSQPIYILGWNNHFQNNQNGAHGSFEVDYLDKNGSKQAVSPAANRPNFQFLKPVPKHFTKIGSKAWYTSIFDITELFQITHPGEYNVSMKVTTRAILETNNNSSIEKIATAGRNAENLSRLIVTSKKETIFLSPSLSQKTLRRRSGLGLCSDNRKMRPIVLRARENARNLAKHAQNIDDSALWAEYFNSLAAELRVKRVYQGIINYGRNGNFYGITEYCDANNEDPECTDDEQVLAYRNPYQVGTNTTTITLCAHFIYLQQRITCNYPSNFNPNMVDQGGLFLHELTHVKNLVGYADISDGAHADCYSWNCVQAAVAGDDDEIPPWHIGRAYELYAYAARALGTRSCNINATLVDNIQTDPSTQLEGSQRSLLNQLGSTSVTQQVASKTGRPMPETVSIKSASELKSTESMDGKKSELEGGEDSPDGDKGCLACK